VVRGAADSTFPALQRVPDEVVSDLLDEPAPELELTDQAGTSRRLSDFAGRVAAVHFWTPWSGVSTQTLVGLLDLDADFPPEDVVVLPVIAEDDASRRLGIGALALQEIDSSVAAYRPNLAHLAAFHADAVVPVTLIIDREGIVRKAFLGYTGRERLKASIREVLEGT
jgi:peroxiredoxin